MGTRGTVVVREESSEREAYLYQHNSADPEGIAATLRDAIVASRPESSIDSGVVNLMSALLPNDQPRFKYLELDQRPHSHGDASYRYNFVQQHDQIEVTVLDVALDLTKPENISVLGFEFFYSPSGNKAYVPIFQGSLEEFMDWSTTFDPDSEEAINILREASGKLQNSV